VKAKPEKSEKVVKENKNTNFLGFESKTEEFEENKIVPENKKFSNPFGGNSLGLIGASKVQDNRRGKSIRDEKSIVVNNSKSIVTKN